jgi:endonuclease/exonuclease/phosphatase family metal-dependent hydrolase
MLTVATYNVHACVGLDRRRDVARVGRVLRRLDADIIGLQEVLGPGADLEDMGVLPVAPDSDPDDLDQLAILADTLGYDARAGANLLRAGQRFGNALLSRHPIVSARRLDLARGEGREPRGAIDALIETPDGLVRIVVTHFGLNGPERAWQAERLAILLSAPQPQAGQPPRGTILLGDFNDMWPPSATYRPLATLQGAGPPWRRTWPAAAPLLPLDKIWPGPGTRLRQCRAWRGREARMASDHLPLVGHLELAAPAPSPAP